MGISYDGRDYAEGKKIGWKDGFDALHCIVRYGLRQQRAVRRAAVARSSPGGPELATPQLTRDGRA